MNEHNSCWYLFRKWVREGALLECFPYVFDEKCQRQAMRAFGMCLQATKHQGAKVLGRDRIRSHVDLLVMLCLYLADTFQEQA